MMLRSTLVAVLFATATFASSSPHEANDNQRRSIILAGEPDIVTLMTSYSDDKIVPVKGKGKFAEEGRMQYAYRSKDGTFDHEFDIKFGNSDKGKKKIRCTLEGKLTGAKKGEPAMGSMDFLFGAPESQKGADYYQSPCGKQRGVKIICDGVPECPRGEGKKAQKN